MAGERRDPPTGIRSERSRVATVEAALALLAELPYSRVTVEAIAARAGVGKATIYRRWPHRAALLVDAVAHRGAPEGMAFPDTGDLRRDLATVLRAVVDELADPAWDALLRALAAEALLDPDVRARVRDVVLTPQLDAFTARLATARAAGQVDPGVADLDVFELVFAPIHHRWQHGTAALDHDHADAVAARAVLAVAPRLSSRAGSPGP